MCVQMTRCTQKHYDSGKILCDYKKICKQYYLRYHQPLWLQLN